MVNGRPDGADIDDVAASPPIATCDIINPK
jgi:hypothetical protein